MSVDFVSPSFRASSGDLTVAISPLGLVELADEEFEVHGPRLNRYAQNWAWFLGHHWSHRRELGEPQLTFNYVEAFASFINNFCFGRGVYFRTPLETSAIVPSLLSRVWEVDNDKESLLLELGQLGGVSGDVFIKVAYEEPWLDPAKGFHPGRVRIVPINGAHAFPEWHPHDRNRLLRFKMKYKFWGCFPTQGTEALTARGWKRHDELLPDDVLLTLDPSTDAIQWQQPTAINVYDYDGDMLAWNGRVEASATPNHRWLVEMPNGERRTVRGEFLDDLPRGSRLVLSGGTPLEFAKNQKWSDETVETVGWYVCDGSLHVNQTGFRSIHMSAKKPHKLAAWRRLAAEWRADGATWNESTKPMGDGLTQFYLGKGVVDVLDEVAPNKQLTPEFLASLTYRQALLLRDTLLDGDGSRTKQGANTVRWSQVDPARKDAYQMLCAMLGIRTNQNDPTKVQELQAQTMGVEYRHETREHYTGKVWCPTVPTGYFMVRQNGHTFWTGNTTADGTRQVFTYTEILTDTQIEEYVNDELIDARENPLGVIPIVHIPNLRVSGSPWGLSDIGGIIPLNREYNEKSTEISDIINYHAAPVTVITGAKASQLEKGPKKVWGGLPKDAQVFNLELGANLEGPMSYLDRLKKSMHELTGVPEGALGDVQPISNTSGVALAIQYTPMMQRYRQKTTNYGHGICAVNELVLRTLAIKEPLTFQWDPGTNDELKDGQLPVLDPDEAVTYQTECHWPPPLPVDILIKLNEVQMKMALGLESKRGALRDLGEEFPDNKSREIFLELVEDAIDQGALDMLKSQIAAAVMSETGMLPTPDGPQPDVQSAGGPGVTTSNSAAGGGAPAQTGPPAPLPPEVGEMVNQLNTRAYGTKLAQRRNPNNDSDD